MAKKAKKAKSKTKKAKKRVKAAPARTWTSGAPVENAAGTAPAAVDRLA